MKLEQECQQEWGLAAAFAYFMICFKILVNDIVLGREVVVGAEAAALPSGAVAAAEVEPVRDSENVAAVGLVEPKKHWQWRSHAHSHWELGSVAL
jgi:hypothetical protein